LTVGAGIITHSTEALSFESLSTLAERISAEVASFGSKLNMSEGIWDLSNISYEQTPTCFKDLEIRGIPLNYDDIPVVVYISKQLTALYGDARDSYLQGIAAKTTLPMLTNPPVLGPPLCDGVIILDPANNPSFILKDLGLPISTPASQIAFDSGTRYLTPGEYASEGYGTELGTAVGYPSTYYVYFAASYVTRQGETKLSLTLAIGPMVSYNSIILGVVPPIPPEVTSIRYYAFPRTIKRTTHFITIIKADGSTVIVPISNNIDTPTMLATFNSVLLPSKTGTGLTEEELFIDAPFSNSNGSSVDYTTAGYNNYFLFSEVFI
jgi:hypothetical protein